MDVFEKLSLYFQFPFVRYALVVGVLIALCSSLFGVTLVLKKVFLHRRRTFARCVRRGGGGGNSRAY